MEELIPMQAALLYIGAAVIFSWGVAHLIPTRNVVTLVSLFVSI